MTDESDAQRKAKRLQQRADRLKADFEARAAHNADLYGRFAGGQPIVPGHSRRSALRDRARADAHFDRTIDVYKEAEKAAGDARWAQVRADAQDAITAVTSTRERPWGPADFLPGDIVMVRTFQTGQDTYLVKRVNKKTLTLDGGGGGWDDPKREYDRVLSRTRGGVTVTNPAEGENQ
ncbi:DUF3560 domain-containing protein [Streptomyces sp. A1277]|uniref:DUF3560 domain-containing protein n=1 Tax=Streptomyces sp. A1277 TaxID=2563103 RepID=UPI001444FBA7|nr:DUF3560 domain-containing protein [Streptomyces sp. A1277]